MSDYQVTLVNNKMNEFFIKFYGPAESECYLWLKLIGCSALCQRRVEDPRRAARAVPLQEPFDWIHEQDLPSQY
jgi:hypothetical protein